MRLTIGPIPFVSEFTRTYSVVQVVTMARHAVKIQRRAAPEIDGVK